MARSQCPYNISSGSRRGPRGPCPPPPACKKWAQKRWLPSAATYISCFLPPPLSEISGSATEHTNKTQWEWFSVRSRSDGKTIWCERAISQIYQGHPKVAPGLCFHKLLVLLCKGEGRLWPKLPGRKGGQENRVYATYSLPFLYTTYTRHFSIRVRKIYQT